MSRVLCDGSDQGVRSAPAFIPMFMLLDTPFSPEFTQVAYTITFLITWLIMLVIWMTLGLPVGPGAPIYLPS